ncbi:hypothetical protein ACFWYW_58040 [Nonomuraea sp. NPDC059023]|uniref:hypothetical protein n=1 Tax=unclassified Nonomuraea TaxID=2593643 RepID=UPI00368B238D
MLNAIGHALAAAPPPAPTEHAGRAEAGAPPLPGDEPPSRTEADPTADGLAQLRRAIITAWPYGITALHAAFTAKTGTTLRAADRRQLAAFAADLTTHAPHDQHERPHDHGQADRDDRDVVDAELVEGDVVDP